MSHLTKGINTPAKTCISVGNKVTLANNDCLEARSSENPHGCPASLTIIISTPAETDPSIESSPVRRRFIPEGAERLNLRWEGIGPEEAKLLAEELATNTTLKELSLDCNKIGNDGAIALADALTTNKSLEKLGLYRNEIGDGGTIALADALATNKTLEELTLWGNDIGNAGMEALGRALMQNDSLEELRVVEKHCGIRAAGLAWRHLPLA
jgi:Leucine Rich repeat